MTDTLVEDQEAQRAPTASDQTAAGLRARARVNRSAHGDWSPPAERADPIGLLEEQAVDRVPELVPVRYGRMLASPFAFFRGAALVMASDLASTPTSGIEVQVCGDAHASNFGVFASPDRELVFDLNDFDETTSGPWEWDVKRLAVSLEIAARERGFSYDERTTIVGSCLRAYRDAMAAFAHMGHLECWYARADASSLARWETELNKKQIARTRGAAEKARRKTSLRALEKLTTLHGDERRFLSDPPLLTPLRELAGDADVALLESSVTEVLRRYLDSLQPHLRRLLSNYRMVDMARKVVGVGSVGTRAWVVLLVGQDAGDFLVLQAKEAEASVLERFVGPSRFGHHGRRVVEGQRLMQAASDVLLGWLRVDGLDGVTRDFYVRQLWDGKGSVDLGMMVPRGMRVYGEVCAWTLARAHARTGAGRAIAAYLGRGDAFPKAIRRFASTYADLNERDHEALVRAARLGRVPVIPDL